MSRMKILWFSNTPANADEYFNSELKGTGGWLKSLDREMQDKVDLHVAFYVDFPQKEFKYMKTHYYPINKFKNKFEKIRTRLLNIEIKEKDTEKYLAVVNTVKPDLIHIHGTEYPFISIIGKINIPVVVSIQGNLTVYQHKFYSGVESKYSSMKSNDSLIKIIFYPTTFKKSFKAFIERSKIEQKYLDKCKYVLGRTDWDKRITRILAPESKYFHSDEILRDGFYNNKWENPENKDFVIFTTNGNNIYKGFETICESLFMLNKLGKKVKWRIAGINENDLIVKVVKKKLKNRYPQQNLELLGNLRESELIKNLIKSNIYVMPSHIENSPNNLCEAMILGMPCIATYVGGTGSLMDDRKEGILIQDGDPWSMAGAILEMKNNYKSAIKMGIKAREKALERHDKEKIIFKLVRIYDGVVNEKK